MPTCWTRRVPSQHLNRMVESLKIGNIAQFLAFDRQGEALHIN